MVHAAANVVDWAPLISVALSAMVMLIGALASIIFWDLRSDIKRAVDTLENVLHRLEDHEDRLRWVEGFNPTREQLAARSRGGVNGPN